MEDGYWFCPYVVAGLTSLATAAKVDYNAFKSFQSVDDFAAYDWKVALFRWGQGFVIGFMGAWGIYEAV